MDAKINELVRMGDVQTLYELMAEDDDLMVQLDAAEGLVRLGDIRGLEFLRSAQLSEDREVRQVAREILSDPAVEAKRGEIEADSERELQQKKLAAVKRVQSGRKVFEYKMVFLATSEFMDEDPLGEGYDVPALTEYGLDGWEVVSVVPRLIRPPGQALGNNAAGAYFLLKRDLTSADSAELA